MQKESTANPGLVWGLGARLFNQPYLLLVLAVLFWSGNFVLGRAVRGIVPPIGLAYWRWFGGSMVLLGFAWPHLRRDWPLIRHHWRSIMLLSLLGIAIFNTFVYIGLQYTTAINGLLMQSLIPVLIVLMSYLFFRETVTAVQAVGIAISLSGAVTIVAQGNLEVLLNLSLNVGDIWILAAVVCYAAYTALLRLRPLIHPLSFLAVTFIPGAVMLLPFYLWESLTVQAMQLNIETVLAVGYVALFPAIVAYLCYNRGVELAGANTAGLFLHLLPVFGSLLAILLLGEQFQLFHMAGILLILSGIVLATRMK